MTNFEKYKNEVLRILEVSECETPGVKNGILTMCDSMPCNECYFHGDDINCVHEFINWLYEDDGEEPDGCDGCKYEYKSEDESPCTECCNNYTSKWKCKPKKTRQDEFLEYYPNAKRCYGVVNICPKNLDMHFNCRAQESLSGGCTTCRQDYWLQEGEE